MVQWCQDQWRPMIRDWRALVCAAIQTSHATMPPLWHLMSGMSCRTGLWDTTGTFIGPRPPWARLATGTGSPKTKRSVEKPVVRPAIFDGKGSWEDYHAQVKILATLNGWVDGQLKATYLAVSLSGPARAVLGDLSEAERCDYAVLVKALDNHFGTGNRSDMYRATLKSRMRKADESLPELAQAIRRLARQAFPGVPSDIRDTLAQDHFVDALGDADMRWKVHQSRPKTLDEAMTIAVELEAFIAADRQWGRPVRAARSSPEPQSESVRSEPPVSRRTWGRSRTSSWSCSRRKGHHAGQMGAGAVAKGTTWRGPAQKSNHSCRETGNNQARGPEFGWPRWRGPQTTRGKDRCNARLWGRAFHRGPRRGRTSQLPRGYWCQHNHREALSVPADSQRSPSSPPGSTNEHDSRWWELSAFRRTSQGGVTGRFPGGDTRHLGGRHWLGRNTGDRLLTQASLRTETVRWPVSSEFPNRCLPLSDPRQ